MVVVVLVVVGDDGLTPPPTQTHPLILREEWKR